MSFGGSAPSAPEPLPEKQQTKSLSAGAAEAAQAQRDRAKRNRGLTASILTQRDNLGGGMMTSSQQGNTTLGQ